MNGNEEKDYLRPENVTRKRNHELNLYYFLLSKMAFRDNVLNDHSLIQYIEKFVKLIEVIVALTLGY